MVLWVSADVSPEDVWKEMNRREQLFGIAEKLAKRDMIGKGRPKMAAPLGRRVRGRR